MSLPPRVRRSPSLLVACLVAVELAVCVAAVGMTGGLRAAPAPLPPTVAVGTPVDAGRYDITVRRAFTADKDPTFAPEYAERGRFLVVEADLELSDDESTDSATDIQRGLAVRLPDGFTIDGGDPGSQRLRTGTVLAVDRSPAQLHPGLPRRVLVVYALPRRHAWPKRLDLTVYRYDVRPGFLDESEEWRIALGDPSVSRVRVPVARRPA